METETVDHVDVEVPAGRLLFPHIYEPAQVPVQGGERFEVVVPADVLRGAGVDPVATGWRVRRARDGEDRVGVRSRIRPEVVPFIDAPSWPDDAPVDRLVKELARLDARNVRRDLVFLDRPTVVRIRSVEYDNPRAGLGVLAVLVSVTVYL